MPVQVSQLKRGEQVALSTTQVINFFRYSTVDAVATVQAAGYFNLSRAKLKVGDVIEAKVGIGGTPKLLFLHVATVPAAADITVTTETFT